MPTLKFSTKAKSASSTKTIVQARNFNIIIDEPASLGGTDEGANPVEYVLAAYSGCINVVGHLVAKEMNINLKGMDIDMEGELDPEKFMGKPTEKRAGYSVINVTVTPDCDADEATLQKWLEAIESRCPVSDNITTSTPVNVKLG